jgi:hypothetical protein
MRKKLFAVLSIVTILAMESVTVFATSGSPGTDTAQTTEENEVNTGQTLDGSVKKSDTTTPTQENTLDGDVTTT